MLNNQKRFSYKVCVEYNNKPLMDKDGAEILQSINQTHSISKTSKNLKVSYRYVWNYLRQAQSVFGQPIVETFKGGKNGGGGARLTSMGANLLLEYRQAERYLDAVLSNSNTSGGGNCEVECKKSV